MPPLPTFAVQDRPPVTDSIDEARLPVPAEASVSASPSSGRVELLRELRSFLA